MASAIDDTKPIAGTPTTQSVRDNFTAAKSEITALQTATTAGQLPGTATNDNALAGQVGEVISAINGPGVTPASGTATNIVTISLTAGDWDVNGSGAIYGGSVSTTNVAFGINSVSATMPSFPAMGTSLTQFTGSGTVGQAIMPLMPFRASLATTTTYYLVVQQYGGTGVGANGMIWARRAR